jgi:hypothetical protein
MKITFGGSTIADFGASPRVMFTIDGWSGQSSTQKDELAMSAVRFQAARGNVLGQFVITTKCSYASETAAVGAMAAAYGMLNTTGNLLLYSRSNALMITWASAVLEGVQKVVMDGVRTEIRYTFSITTQTIA